MPVTPAQAALDRCRAAFLATKAAPTASPAAAGEDLASLGDAAPDASPVGAFAFLADPAGWRQAWLTVGEGEDGPVGYIRSAFDPASAVRVTDTTRWQEAVEAMGMTETPVPSQELGADGEGTEPPEPPSVDLAAVAPHPAPTGTGPTAAPAAPAEPAEPTTGADPTAAAPLAPLAEGKAARFQGLTRSASDVQSGVNAPDYSDGIMVALMVPEGDAGDLALDDDRATPADDLHITLAYLGSTNDVPDDGALMAKILEAVREVCADYDAIEGEISGVGRFTTPDGDAFYLSYDSADLGDLRHDLAEALTDAGAEPSRDHGFTPHITLTYLAEGEGNPLRRVTPKALAFTEVSIVYGTSRIDCPLGSPFDPENPDMPTLENTVRDDTTAPSARAEAKGAPPFAKGGGSKPPAIANGSFVSWNGGRGRVDLIVTRGTVPGVDGDVEGSPTSPAARVVVYEQAAGTWKATSRKVGAKVATLKRIPPLNGMSGKALPDTAGLVGAFAEHNQLIDAGALPPHTRVTADRLRVVYQRGVKSYPEGRTALSREDWGAGRALAFLGLLKETPPAGYLADRDLLPAGHPARTAPAAAQAADAAADEVKVSYHSHQPHGGWIWAGHHKGFKDGIHQHKYGSHQVALFRRRGDGSKVDLNDVSWRDVDEEEMPSTLLNAGQRDTLLSHQDTPKEIASAIRTDTPLSADQMREAGDILGGHAQDYLYLQANASEHRHELAGIGDFEEAPSSLLKRRTPVGDGGHRQTGAQRSAQEYRAYLESRHHSAESATGGNLVNAAGQLRGINGRSFFDPRKAPPLSYASEELLDWLRENGPNLKPSDYRRQHDETVGQKSLTLPATLPATLPDPAELVAQLRAAAQET